MQTRLGYKIVILEPALSRIRRDECPNCGLHKDKWNRRKDWRCCSIECTSKYSKNMIIYYNWSDVRRKAFERDNYKCIKCGRKGNTTNLIGDHIKPISLGGEEFNINNVQTLCWECDKIKTKIDQGKISKVRRIEKAQKVNQTLV